MPAPRAVVTQLARLFDAVEQPIYLVDADRRLRYVNRACAAWLGLPGASLIGRECRYCTSGDLPPEERAACALCPPPETFKGAHARASVAAPAADPERSGALVDFIPLRTQEGWAVAAFVSWPSSPVDAASADTSSPELHTKLQKLRQRRAAWYHVDRLMGESAPMRRVRSQIILAAQSTAPVVIAGPPGSGRQHVARTIHYGPDSKTAVAPLVPLACKLLGAELLQTTIRALARTQASMPDARPGTLLLNDVEQLPDEARAELAGFLRHTDLPMRIVSTARQPLTALAESGKFPHDLALMLSALVIELPPLSQRLEDLPLIAQAFVEAENAHSSKQLSGFSSDALDRLLVHPWPGGLDELHDVVREAHARAQGTVITPQDLPKRLQLTAEATALANRRPEPIDLQRFLADIERELIERALRQARGNKARAARLLGLNRPRLYRRMVALGLEPAPAESPKAAQTPPLPPAQGVPTPTAPPQPAPMQSAPPHAAHDESEPLEIDFEPHEDDS